jgi:30S ribosomal protein 3
LDSKFLLKIVWLENKLGIAVDQVIGAANSPLTIYFFWSDQNNTQETTAWDRLKSELDAKHWIPEEKRNEVLNQATDVINYWQDLRDKDQKVTINEAQSHFPEVVFTGSK